MADPPLLLFLPLLVAIPDPSLLLLTHTFPERLPFVQVSKHAGTKSCGGISYGARWACEAAGLFFG